MMILLFGDTITIARSFLDGDCNDGRVARMQALSSSTGAAARRRRRTERCTAATRRYQCGVGATLAAASPRHDAGTPSSAASSGTSSTPHSCSAAAAGTSPGGLSLCSGNSGSCGGRGQNSHNARRLAGQTER